MHALNSLFSLLMALSLAASPLRAQVGQLRSCEKLPQLKQTTTLVVLDDQETAYNQRMRQTIEAYWDITPVKYISQNELPTYLGNAAYSMLVRNNAQRMVRRTGGRTSTVKNNDLGLYLCNQGPMENYLAGDALVMVRLEDVMQTDAYLHKLTGLVQAMLQYLAFLENEQVDENSYDKAIKTYAVRNAARLAEVTLLVCESDLPPKLRKPERLAKVYGHPVEVVDEQAIAEALEAQREGTAFLHLHPRQREFFVIEVAGGTLLYQAEVHSYGQLKFRDFATMGKRAGP